MGKNDKSFRYNFRMNKIGYKYGVPKELENPNNFLLVNGILFFPEKGRVIFLEEIKGFFKSPDITMSLIREVKNLLFQFCPKFKIETINGIQYTTNEGFFAVSYTNKTFSAQQFQSQSIPCSNIKQKYDIHKLNLLKDSIPESKVNQMLENLSRLSLSTIRGFRFWGELTASVYGKRSKDNLFLVYAEQLNDLPVFINNIEKLFGTPFLFCKSCQLKLSDEIIEYQLLSDQIGILSLNMHGQKYRFVEKLVKGIPITLIESIPSWKLQYRNTMPLVVLTTKKKEFDKLKTDCRQKDIACYEFLLFETKNLDELSENEITFLKWCLLAGYYHKPWVKQFSPSPMNLLNRFIDTFCEITGEESDQYRSGKFYSQYIVPYYKANRCQIIGSKVFNKALRNYCPDKMRVASRHVKNADNVQHIIGMKFDEKRFEQYISEYQAETENQKVKFDNYIMEIFDHVEKDMEAISEAINKAKSSGSSLQ